jgi:hypothetical protein
MPALLQGQPDHDHLISEDWNETIAEVRNSFRAGTAILPSTARAAEAAYEFASFDIVLTSGHRDGSFDGDWHNWFVFKV